MYLMDSSVFSSKTGDASAVAEAQPGIGSGDIEGSQGITPLRRHFGGRREV
jgi:hypothetical protein